MKCWFFCYRGESEPRKQPVGAEETVNRNQPATYGAEFVNRIPATLVASENLQHCANTANNE